MSTTYQDYSLDQKAQAITLIEANNGNTSLTARETGISRQLLDYWYKQRDQIAKVLPESKRNLADKLQNIAHNCADLLLEPERMQNASTRDIVGAMAQSIEKYNLINGLPTSIHAEVERQELVVILQSALNAGAAIDALPETDLPGESP